MQRSYPLRWLALALGLGYLGVQCQESLSDDCSKTLTCPDNEVPVLDQNCVWRYMSDGRVWTDGPSFDPATKRWRWPDGKETATQEFDCNPAGIRDAGTDAAPALRCQTTADCDVPLVCDTASNECVECINKTDCADNVAVGDAGAAVACDVIRHECVPCVLKEDCSGDTPVCKTNAENTSRNECVQCLVDADCGGDEPICDKTSNECTTRCTSSEQCSGAKSVCNLTTQLCVECTDNQQCSGTAAQCNTATNECVECINDAPCTASMRVCDTTSNNCVQCVADQQCLNVPNATHCDTDTNICVQCNSHDQCTATDTSRCNPVSHLCVGCTDSSQCENGLLCDLAHQGVCVQCLENADCPLGAPVCETSTGNCVECLNNAECPLADAPRCSTQAGAGQFTCVGCTDNGDCSGGNRGLPGLCNDVTGECVNCVLNGDCSSDATRSRCGNGGVCAVCLTDGDCGGRFGGLQGCAPNQGCVECTSNDHCSDTPTTPVCKLVADANTADAVNTCVECTTNADCTSPGESRCVANKCEPCVANNDCSHLDPNGATTAGGLGVCDGGTCVECTAANRAACGVNVCDSLAKTCTTRPARGADLCGSCVADEECATDARCVLQGAVGYFCFPLQDAGGLCPVRGFAGQTTSVTIDSPSATVCTQRATTCPAFVNYRIGTICDGANDDAACGNSGSCEQGPGDFLCTISCDGVSDCLSGSCVDDLCTL